MDSLSRQDKLLTALFCGIILTGTALRFAPGVLSGFPVNDGGMFLVMIRDLRSNRFILPSTTSYNLSDIPFAYPPFGMYVAGLVSELLNISEVDIIHWLPPLVSAAIIPAFYWLARQIFSSSSKALTSIALYALLPGSFDWLVMGGGLTRSFGVLFSLFAVGHVLRVFRDDNGKSFGPAVLFCALSTLSHPEVGLQVAAICAVFWIFHGKDLRGVKDAIFISGSVIFLTTPWWLAVLYHNGAAPFLSAIHTGIRETLVASLFHSIFSTQGGLPILSTLYLVGVFVVLRRRDFLLVTWALVPYFVDPRNAPAMTVFPIVMLGSEGAYFLYTKFIQAYSKTFPSDSNLVVFPTHLAIGCFTCILIYLFLVSWGHASNLARVSLTLADREAMAWVRKNTPVEAQFLLFTNTGEISPMVDSYQEWFPALAERRSQNTLQGLEWFLGSEFFPYSQSLGVLQSCGTIKCLDDWTQQREIDVNYLVFKKGGASMALMVSLRTDGRYRVVYESDTALIFLANR